MIGRAKFDAILVRANTSREQALAEVRQLAGGGRPPPLPAPVCRDPDDDELPARALAAQVEPIISVDDDLLVLQAFEGNAASRHAPCAYGDWIGVPSGM